MTDTSVDASAKWVCRRCGHESSTKSNLLTHLRRQKPCVARNINISHVDYITELLAKDYNDVTFDCVHCKTKFNSRSSRSRHYKTCSAKNKTVHKEGIINTMPYSELIEVEKIVETLDTMANPHKKKKKKKIPSGLRKACWDAHSNGQYQMVCMCCQRNTITPFDFHCGHVVAEAVGGSLSMDNLRPICGRCNIDMGTEDMCVFAQATYAVILP